MTQLVDIHSHVLFGVDDGSKDYNQSMEMLRIAWEKGITDIIVTPHYKVNRHCVGKKGIFTRIQELEEGMKNEGINIRLYPGNEIFYFSEIVDSLDEGKICTLAGSEYVLIEFSPMDTFLYIRDGLIGIADAGYIPILAHAERYDSLFKEKDGIKQLVGMGVHIQVNTGSVIGDFGRKTAKNAKYLIKENLVNFLATDAHDDKRRAPKIKKCVHYIKKKKGEEVVRQLLTDNPLQILLRKNIT